MLTLRQQLLGVFDAYCAARRLAPATVSSAVFNGGHVIERIREGGDVTTGRFESAVRWFAANWPEGAAWPEGIARPEPRAAAE